MLSEVQVVGSIWVMMKRRIGKARQKEWQRLVQEGVNCASAHGKNDFGSTNFEDAGSPGQIVRNER
jgi:hypothetical protein